MLRFNLKTLFCLTLIIGVALMWVTWAKRNDETANRLLAAREKSETVSFGTPGFWEGIGISSVYYGLDFSSRSMPISRKDSECINLWMDCKLWIHYAPTEEGIFTSPPNVKVSISWQADWNAIEAKAKEENRIFYRNLIVSILASLMVGCVVLGRLVFGKG